MTPSLSSTHALSDQKFLLYPKLTNQKEQCKRLEKSSKKFHMLVEDNYAKKNVLLYI